MKKLSIVVPHYKESEDVIGKLLTSIDFQSYIDFNDVEVIVVNDGGGIVLSNEFLNSFHNFKPTYIKLDSNVGPGMARQAGIDNSTGEWITFIDSDDRLFSCCSLYTYMYSMRTYPEASIIYHQCAMEVNEDLPSDTPIPLLRGGQEAGTLHAGLFRKDILTEGNIRFIPELNTFEEDIYFTNIALTYSYYTGRDVIVMDALPEAATYLYAANSGSLTRRDPVLKMVDIIKSRCIRSKAFLLYLEQHNFSGLYDGVDVENAVYGIWNAYVSRKELLERGISSSVLSELESLVLNTCTEIVQRYGFKIDKGLEICRDRSTVVVNVGTELYEYHVSLDEYKEFIGKITRH